MCTRAQIPSTAEMLSGNGSLPMIPELARLRQRLSAASWPARLDSTAKLCVQVRDPESKNKVGEGLRKTPDVNLESPDVHTTSASVPTYMCAYTHVKTYAHV